MDKARITITDFISPAFGTITVTDMHAQFDGGINVETDAAGSVDLNVSQTKQLIAFLQTAVADYEKLTAPAPAPKPPVLKTPCYSQLTEQGKLIYRHMQRAGSISAREAMNDHGITSATLARRVCDIEGAGFKVVREPKRHPITGKRYTRYALAA